VEISSEDKRKSLLNKRARSLGVNNGYAPSPLSNDTVQRAHYNPQQLSSHDILSLQRTVGNHNVQRLLTSQESRTGSQGQQLLRPRVHSAPPTIQREPEEEEGEHHLPSEELETTEKQGFKLLDDKQEEEGEYHLPLKDLETSEAPAFSLINPENTPQTRSRYQGYGPRYGMHEIEPQKPTKRTIAQKFKSFKLRAKNFVKGQTVYAYGKIGLHAIINQDEKQIRAAARVIKTDPKLARALLRHVHGVTKQDISEISSVGKGIAMALMFPVWFTRWAIAHQQWRRLAKKVGLIAPKQKDGAKPKELPEPEEPAQDWRRAKPQIKDQYGEMHAFMLGVGSNTHKGKGMGDKEKLRVWQKWRLREMDNPSAMLGKQRHEGWLPAYSQKAHRGSNKGPKIGTQRPEWGFKKPIGAPETDMRMGSYRRHWRSKKPEGERSGHRIGLRAPVWNRTKPQSKYGFLGLGRRWGFNKPEGERSGHRVGLRAPVWNSLKPQSKRGFAGMGRKWGFNKPEGERSQHKVGLRAPVWNRTEADGERSKFKLGKQRQRTPWGKAQMPNFLQLPSQGSELSHQRNPNLLILDEPEVSGMEMPGGEHMQDMGGEESHEVTSTTSSQGLKNDEIYISKAPIDIMAVRANIPQTIPAGLKVLITEIGDKEARVDSDTGLSGYAPIAAIKAALGIT